MPEPRTITLRGHPGELLPSLAAAAGSINSGSIVAARYAAIRAV